MFTRHDASSNRNNLFEICPLDGVPGVNDSTNCCGLTPNLVSGQVHA